MLMLVSLDCVLASSNLLVLVMAVVLLFFFFKQKPAYRMRISDWSSDVCSSDPPDRHVDDLAILPRDHPIELARGDQVDRMDAEGRGQQPVARLGRAAALDMAEHRDARLGPGQVGNPLADILADAAIGRLAAGMSGQQRLARLGLHRLSDDDEREVAAALLQVLDLGGDPVETIGNLRYQDHVGAAGDPGAEGEVPGHRKTAVEG